MGLSEPEGLAKCYPLLLPVPNRNHFGSRLNAQCSFIIIYAVVYQRSATCRNRFSFESISATGTVSQHSIILMRCQFVNVNSCTGALLLCTIQCFCVPYYMLNIAIRARRGLHGTTNSELEHCCNVQRRTWLPPDETLLSMSRRQLLLHGHQCRRLSSHQRSPQQRISVFARCSVDQSAYAHSLSASTTIDYVDHRQSRGMSGCFDASYHCPIGHYRWNSATIEIKRCSIVFSSIKLTTETIQLVQQV